MFSSLVLENQFGEVSNNFIKGGSSQLNCKFIVDSTNVNGLGIRSLSGSGIKSVFMHTSASPLGGNPNPVAGYILVQLLANYAAYLNGTSGFVAPLSGSNINVTSGLSVGRAYVITSVGTTTALQWQALGLSAGLTPAVGQSFIAVTASAGSGTGVVQLPASAASGIDHIEIIGDANQSVNPSDASGASFILACVGNTNSAPTLTMDSYTPAGVITNGTPDTFAGTPAVLTGTISAPTSSDVIKAPVDGTVVGLTFNMANLSASLI